MSDAFDALDDEVAEGARSPVSGVTSAIEAGEALSVPDKRRVLVELPAYLYVQIAWFAAFGMQMVVFPYLLKNQLDVSGTLLGAAQMALSLPSVVFILIGGAVAERADGRTLLTIFHLLAAIPAAVLAWAMEINQLTYWIMIVYAVGMGVVGAFMMPARDAILNEVIDRRRRAGSNITLQQGVSFATLAQFAAQIGGLILGGMATLWGAKILMVIQGVIVASGFIAAIGLSKGQMIRSNRQGAGAVFGEIKDGLKTVKENPILLSMVGTMFGIGVFVIGAFLVVLPIVNDDIYHLNSGGLRNIFVTFWAGAFVSSVAMSVSRAIKRPGRLQTVALGIGALCILIMVKPMPYMAFLSIVFIWGLCAGVCITMSRSIVQKAAPPQQLARVLSIYQLGFMGGAPLGAASMGILTDAIGPQLVAVAPAIGLFGIIILLIVATPIWKLSQSDLEACNKHHQEDDPDIIDTKETKTEETVK